MATKKEIEAAYQLIFDNEKTTAETVIALVEKFQADLRAINDSLASASQTSAIKSTVGQLTGNISMLEMQLNTLKAAYGLNLVDPMMPPPPMTMAP